jgi:O-acetylhomoserine (thiol)-lyase
VRFAKDDSAEAIAALIDDKTKAVYCESIGNPAGNIVDIAALAKVARPRRAAHRRQHGRHPGLCKPIEHGADIVVHSLTKYVGGHGNSWGRHRRLGQVPWADHAERFPS